jgi:hypothetical protein
LARGGIVPIIPTDQPLPEVDFDGVGPAVGERFPDLELPNQWGELVDLHERRGERRGLVVIHRSADW